MRFSPLLFCGWLLLVCSNSVVAQSIQVVAETSSFIDYELKNEELRVLPPNSMLVPFVNGSAQYKILEQSITTASNSLNQSKIKSLLLSSDSSSVIEVFEPGFFKAREFSPIRINTARYNQTELLITRYLKFRVYKAPKLSKPNTEKRKIATSLPLLEGTWYKIPISKNGVYSIDRSYLTDLGMDPSSVNPKNIQLWGNGGKLLPEAISDSIPEFVQIPIIVEGEADASFDQNDKVVFYANSPNLVYQNGDNFFHQVHPYSFENYVFLTVGSTPGLRLSPINNSLNPTSTTTTFKDFIWKDEELTKSESKIRSGREWLGQTVNSSQSGNFISILKDTLSGIVPNPSIKIDGRIYGRSLRRLYSDIKLNTTNVATVSASSIDDFDDSEGSSASGYNFSKTVTPSIENGIIDLQIKTTFNSSNDQLFVDWLRIVVQRELTLNDDNLLFFTPYNSDNIEVTTYLLKGFSTQPYVMDISNPVSPKLLTTSASGSNFELNYYKGSNLQVIAQSQLFTPQKGERIQNQGIKEITAHPDYIVITSEELLSAALELAEYRSSQGLVPLVVTQKQIFNEFSGGLKDPSALRNFVKYIYDEAILNGELLPKYLLLFGDTSYDPKGIVTSGLTNHVITYESKESVHRTGTFGTDDYFAYLDDNEGDFATGSTPNSHLMDVGVGRIPVQTSSEARAYISKLKSYEDPKNKGTWQNLVTFAADDDFPKPLENKDLHTYNADISAELMNVNEPGIRIKKIYEFSYPIEINGAGRQIPEATKDLMSTVNNGTLILSYLGHGNEQTLTDEEFFTSDYITDFTNKDKLCVLITATCQFGRYDDTGAQSGAEKFVLATNGGAIASFTTTRVVYTGSLIGSNTNFALSVALSQRMSERNPDGNPKRLGDIAMQTKNTVLPGYNWRVGASLNNKKFVLLGDPATIFQLPSKKAQLSSISNIDVLSQDTLITVRALDTVELSGSILNANGATDTQYNGQSSVTIYDARRTISLPERSWIDNRQRDCNLDNCEYFIESDILFKGKANVVNGEFTLPVIIPKDISSSTSTGRILLYAEADGSTASGAYTNIRFNGLNPDAVNDGTGPALNIFLNDESFINGTLVNSSPSLYVELEDESGINTSGTGVGHEIIATIDTKPQQTIILNDFYEGNLNNFTGGHIEYPLDELPEGSYTLKVRAWDVHNNPTEKEIFFEVAAQEELVVRNTYNYPNPMNNKTSFTFEHNQPGNPLDVSVRIYTLSGKPVQQLKESIITSSNYASISWNGRDRDNDRLGNGTYIYVLRVTTDTPKGKQSTEKIEKLVIIR